MASQAPSSDAVRREIVVLERSESPPDPSSRVSNRPIGVRSRRADAAAKDHGTQAQNDGKSEAPLVSERGFINPAASYSPTENLCSTIGSGGLDFRVRDGIGYDPSDIATETCRSVCSHSENRTLIPTRIRHEGEALLREQGGRAEGETHLEALASNPDLENFLRLVP